MTTDTTEPETVWVRAARRIEQIKETTGLDTLAHLVGQAMIDAHRLDEQLVEACETSIRTLQSAIADVEHERSVNSLGILQGRALDVDRLAGLRHAARQQVTKLDWLVESTVAEIAAEVAR